MKIIIDISEYEKEWITNGYSIPQELNTDIARKIIEAESLSFDDPIFLKNDIKKE